MKREIQIDYCRMQTMASGRWLHVEGRETGQRFGFDLQVRLDGTSAPSSCIRAEAKTLREKIKELQRRAARLDAIAAYCAERTS